MFFINLRFNLYPCEFKSLNNRFHIKLFSKLARQESTPCVTGINIETVFPTSTIFGLVWFLNHAHP